MKPLNMIKFSTLAISFAFSSATIAGESASTTTNDWQSSLAAEFSKLDASGNGLLMPFEASRGKAFSKKTFAAADSDNDGTLDQAEYINHRTSMGATNQPGTANINTAPDSGFVNTVAETSNLDSGTADRDTKAKNRSVGVVIDDSVITTKAKAAIFNTPDLKTLQISVKTRQGEVTLTGTVKSDAAKIKAEEVVKNVNGVTVVTNNLQVKN